MNCISFAMILAVSVGFNEVCKQTNYICTNIRNIFQLHRVDPFITPISVYTFFLLHFIVSICRMFFFHLSCTKTNAQIPRRCRTSWISAEPNTYKHTHRGKLTYQKNQRCILVFNLSSLRWLSGGFQKNVNIHNDFGRPDNSRELN